MYLILVCLARRWWVCLHLHGRSYLHMRVRMTVDKRDPNGRSELGQAVGRNRLYIS